MGAIVATIDAGKLRRKPKPAATPEVTQTKQRKWLSLHNEALWTRFWTVSR
jgi:hypothetical protein